MRVAILAHETFPDRAKTAIGILRYGEQEVVAVLDRTSAGTTDVTENVVVTIEANGKTGYGAAAPSTQYGKTAATVQAQLPDLLDVVERVGDPHARRTVSDRMHALAMWSQPAIRS